MWSLKSIKCDVFGASALVIVFLSIHHGGLASEALQITPRRTGSHRFLGLENRKTFRPKLVFKSGQKLTSTEKEVTSTSGSLPSTSGSLPSTAGSLHSTRGSFSSTSGLLSSTSGSLSSTSGSLPSISGSLLSSRLTRLTRDLRLPHYRRANSPPRFRFTPPEQTLSPGSPVTLKCVAEGSPPPIITWTRDGEPIIPTLGTDLGSYISDSGLTVSHVNISSVTPQEGGLITCSARNILGTETASNRLNIYGPPYIRERTNNVSAVEGSDAIIWCPAGGYPPPTLTWFREGKRINSNSRYEILSNFSLLIRKAQREDSSSYQCTATSHRGQTSTSNIRLFVIAPPVIDDFKFPKEQQEGGRSQVACVVTSGDLPLLVSWHKDGHPLVHDPDRVLKELSQYSSVLMFEKLSERHSGDYTCIVSNAAASVNYTAKLTVKVSPRWVITPQSANKLVGERAVFHCEARGNPTPKITWKKASGPEPRDYIPLSQSVTNGNQALNGSLIFSQVRRNDVGWYLCEADNGVGAPLSESVKLSVFAGAKISTPGGRITGHSSHTAKLTCTSIGDQPLSIRWSREGMPITANTRFQINESSSSDGSVTSILRVTSLITSDGGEYRCTAVNDHSTDASVYTLIVLEPPKVPGDVRVSSVSSHSALVSWTAEQGSNILLQYSVTTSDWGWHNVTISSWSSEHILSDLKPHTSYKLRLIANNELGHSLPSNERTFTTEQEAPSGSPRDVRASTVTTDSLSISWRSPLPSKLNGPIRGYSLTLRQQNPHGYATSIIRPVSNDSPQSSLPEQYTVRGLKPGTLYEIAVRAFNSAGMGPMSSPRIVRSTLHSEPRCPPTTVSCRGSGPTSVRVSWGPPVPQCGSNPITKVDGYLVTATHTSQNNKMKSDHTRVEVSTTNLEKSVPGLRAASNISIQVRAFNDQGISPPSISTFCSTHDALPSAPRRLRGVSTSVSSVLVAWDRPHRYHGTLLHYTLYSHARGQTLQRELVAASSIDATWRELTSLLSGNPVQVWISATTSAGEGPFSNRITLTPTHSTTHPPLTLGGGREWWISENGGVTLGCRRVGIPQPSVKWMRQTISNDNNRMVVREVHGNDGEQLLPGGDLHVSDLKVSTNFTCKIKNKEGSDELTHIIHVTSPPDKPTISLTHATHSSLNLTIHASTDGGAPILGYRIHYRLPSGSWEEISVVPSASSSKTPANINTLPCGTPVHIYGVAWNHYGTSSASSVVVGKTSGSVPPRPDPQRLIEVNETCVILKLYTWPERGCLITGWKVEQQQVNSVSREWQVIGSPIGRDTTDFAICDFLPSKYYLLKMTAMSDAGPNTILYKVKTTADIDEPYSISSLIQEVQMTPPMSHPAFFDAPIIAGSISALLLATAAIICACVGFNRRKLLLNATTNTSNDDKSSEKPYTSIRGTMTKGKEHSKSTPIKKAKCRSMASLSSQNTMGDSYEIYPYATFRGGTDHDTLHYGIDIQNKEVPQDCFEGAYSTRPQMEIYKKNSQKTRWPDDDTVYKEVGGEMWVKLGESGPSRRAQTPANGMETVVGVDSSTDTYETNSPVMQRRSNRPQRPIYQVIASPVPNPNQRYDQQHPHLKHKEKTRPLQGRPPMALPPSAVPHLSRSDKYVARSKPEVDSRKPNVSSNRNFIKSWFFNNDKSVKLPWRNFMKRNKKHQEEIPGCSALSNDIAEKSYVKFVPYPENLYGEKIYIRRSAPPREGIYNDSDKMESLYNSTQHDADSVIYSGKSLSSNNNGNLSSEYHENCLPVITSEGEAIAISSSNDSIICANKVFRPPSLFSDSREMSEAECDRYNKQNAETNSEPSPIEESEVAENEGDARKNQNEATGDSEPKEQELTVILNRIYEHQSSSQIMTASSESPYTPDSEKSAYSINV